MKWVRISKWRADNLDVRCRLVAQELGFGERLDRLFAGYFESDREVVACRCLEGLILVVV